MIKIYFKLKIIKPINKSLGVLLMLFVLSLLSTKLQAQTNINIPACTDCGSSGGTVMNYNNPCGALVNPIDFARNSNAGGSGGPYNQYSDCFISSEGFVYGWGRNEHGEIGYAPDPATGRTITHFYHPVPAQNITAALPGVKFKQIEHNKYDEYDEGGYRWLLSEDGKVYRWGYYRYITNQHYITEVSGRTTSSYVAWSGTVQQLMVPLELAHPAGVKWKTIIPSGGVSIILLDENCDYWSVNLTYLNTAGSKNLTKINTFPVAPKCGNEQDRYFLPSIYIGVNDRLYLYGGSGYQQKSFPGTPIKVSYANAGDSYGARYYVLSSNGNMYTFTPSAPTPIQLPHGGAPIIDMVSAGIAWGLASDGSVYEYGGTPSLVTNITSELVVSPKANAWWVSTEGELIYVDDTDGHVWQRESQWQGYPSANDGLDEIATGRKTKTGDTYFRVDKIYMCEEN